MKFFTFQNPLPGLFQVMAAPIKSLATLDRDNRINFWAKVDIRGPDECWEWMASKNKNGYGRFAFNRKTDTAHRFAYVITYGPLTEENPCVLHSCNNPGCVNPRHLRAGTQYENNQDRNGAARTSAGENHSVVMKQVAARGERQHCSKLTSDSVLEIRHLHVNGASKGDLGRMFGVAFSTIRKVVNLQTWRHIR
jgi:hypothetical protein